MLGAAQQIEPPPVMVRAAIRDILTGNGDYQSLPLETRREVAQGLVKICSTALALADETDAATAATSRQPLVRPQSAQDEFGGGAVDRIASTTKQILGAVSFPRFVTELINGVFKALVDTNQQQMDSFVDLIRNVAASTEGFADANVGLGGARQWLAERFAGSFVIEGEIERFDETEPMTPEERAELEASTRLRLRPGASMPTEGALRVALGLGPQDSVPTGDPENLVALARANLARNRQQMLATMVMLGLQRIVIESGRLHASMRFHIDARSAAAQDRGSQLDTRHTSSAGGSFGAAGWGASAKMTNTIGYVSTQKTQTTEELNADLDLNSSVELVFKTDYLPLDRLAGRDQVDRIKVNTLNPEAEAKAAGEARKEREKRVSESEKHRWDTLQKSFPSPSSPEAPPKPGERGSVEDAEKARKDAEAKKKAEQNASNAPVNPPTGGGTTTNAPANPPTGGGTTTNAPANPPTGGGTTTNAPANPPTGGGTTTNAPANPPPGGGTTTNAPANPPTGGGTTTNAPANPPTGGGTATNAPANPPTGGGSATGTPVTPVRPAGLSVDSGSRVKPRSNGRPDVIFVPTPNEIVTEMLKLAAPRRGELLFDLGCGDGRVAVAAAKNFGCRAVGFDIDPERVEEARQNVRINRVEDLVRIKQQDMFDADLGEADVVTVYLLPELNVRLMPQFDRMKPGARIVSHDFDMEGVIPDRAVQVYLPQRNIYKTIYLWTIPLKRTQRPVPHEWSNSKAITAA